jgi:iron(III) transport system ATP-binding protein
MLLDEPFSALDTGLRAQTRKAVAELLGGAGITAILVTHDQEEALSFADRVAVMRDGRLLQVGTPREIYWKPRDAMVASFLGDAIVLPATLSGGFADCVLGRVPTDSSRSGAATIMLRPEQIKLRSDDGTDAAVRARVLRVEFGGASCAVSLEPCAEPGSPPLVLHKPFAEPPEAGALVRVEIAGRAHVLSGSESN